MLLLLAEPILYQRYLGAGLLASSLSKFTRSPFSDVTRSMQSPGIVAYVMIADDFLCQNSNPRSCAFDNRTQYTALWVCFQVAT